MSDKLDQIKDLIKAEIEGEIEEIKASAQPDDELIADLAATEERINLAVAAGDYGHVAKELTAHLPALANREWLEDREERKAAWKARIQRIVAGILQVGLGSLAALILLVMIPGCAAWKTSNVTTVPIRGEMANVCEAHAKCVDQDLASPLPGACGEDPTSLLNQMRTKSTVKASVALAELAPLCDQIDSCVASWSGLAQHLKLAWPEWCETLEENAKAAG
jgi:hypothetical protein